MGELICHLFGDFVLQNHWMALNKTRSSYACLVHVILYTLPFLLLTRHPVAITIIFGTHFIIDRWSLAKRWPAFWGVGCEGWVMAKTREYRRCLFLSTWHLDREWREDSTTHGNVAFNMINPPIESVPPFLAVWLTIIVDNTIHIMINHCSIMYFG